MSSPSLPQATAASRPRGDLPALPRATYRLQLTEEHGFKSAARLVPYLARLGISDAYLSPYLKTRPHSLHGYDVIDHSRLNPELGDEESYEQLCRNLAEHGMRQLLDIVPNHIGIMGSENEWWLDVLGQGGAGRQDSGPGPRGSLR
jgi:(1->4)-alpha-D-glucan 1-alpha-D-glucosylmutase